MNPFRGADNHYDPPPIFDRHRVGTIIGITSESLSASVRNAYRHRPDSARYLALRDFRLHLERVKARADAGGHSASEATLRRIYDASLLNLRRAVEELDAVWIYDNTDIDASHPLVLEARDGEIHFVADRPPDWLKAALDLS